MIDRILQINQALDFDFRRLANPADAFAHRFNEWVPYYRMKAAIAQALKPKTILEIGVRYGYSGAAFLHGAPQAHYTGIDLDADSFGGEKGAIEWARRILPAGQFELVVADTQKLPRFPGGIYDLVHVDGQQDEAGTFHDLVLAVRQARFILVDGYFWTQENYSAVNDFLWRFREDVEYYGVIPGYAGEMLIKIKAPPESMAAASPAVASAAIRSLYTADYFLKNCGGWEFFGNDGSQILQDGRLRSMADLLFARPGRRVLDLGAGRGELTVLAALAGCEVTAVDYSPAAVDILRTSLAALPATAGKVECICADVTTFEAGEGYDTILAGDVIEHLSPAELELLYTRVARWLGPDGRFIVHTFPNRWFYDYAHRWRRAEARRLGARLPANPRSRYELLMHINEQSPRILRRSLRRHFPHVCLWFGSPEDPGGNLVRRVSHRALAEYRDLYAIASPAAIDQAGLAALFTSGPLQENDFLLEIIAAPATAGSGQQLRCAVRVTNRSRHSVLASRPPFPVYLSYRWLDSGGQTLPLEGWRNLLSPALGPDQSHTYHMQVIMPDRTGTYRLVFSLVQEQQSWLCDTRPELCPGQTVVVS